MSIVNYNITVSLAEFVHLKLITLDHSCLNVANGLRLFKMCLNSVDDCIASRRVLDTVSPI